MLMNQNRASNCLYIYKNLLNALLKMKRAGVNEQRHSHIEPGHVQILNQKQFDYSNCWIFIGCHIQSLVRIVGNLKALQNHLN